MLELLDVNMIVKTIRRAASNFIGREIAPVIPQLPVSPGDSSTRKYGPIFAPLDIRELLTLLIRVRGSRDVEIRWARLPARFLCLASNITRITFVPSGRENLTPVRTYALPTRP